MTSTTPASGKAGELLAHAVQRGAELRLRAGEREVVGRGQRERPTDENRKVRTTKRSDSAFRTPPVRIGELLPRRSLARGRARACDGASPICMLRESSISTARKFCCATAALTTSTGRKRQTAEQRDQGQADREQATGAPARRARTIGGAAAAGARRRHERARV